MSKFTHIALSALELPNDGRVPEWVHLVPKGQFGARDGRGPWAYTDAAQLIANSFAAYKHIHIDINHSTDHAAPSGNASEAVGYIKEMEERENGIWGRVDWNVLGEELLSDRRYWGLSPVIKFDPETKAVSAIWRAALTNNPAVADLTPLSTKETQDMFLKKLVKMLDLEEDATEEAVMSALKKKLDGKSEDKAKGEESLAALSSLAVALGVESDADSATVLATAKALKAGSGETATALAALQVQIKELRDGGKKTKAEAFVDQAIKDRHVGVKAARDEYVALHVENPERTAKMIAALPKLDPTNTTIDAPETDGQVALSTSEADVAAMLGVDPEKMAEVKAADAKKKGAL